jgi:hypothetical protein
MNTGIAISMGEAINAMLVLGVLAILLVRH